MWSCFVILSVLFGCLFVYPARNLSAIPPRFEILRSSHGSILFVPSTPSCGPSAEDPGHAHAMPSLLCLRIAGFPLLFLSCLFVCSRLLLCSSHIATFDCQQRSPFIPTVYIHKLSIMHISPLVSFSYTHALLLPVFCRPRVHRRESPPLSVPTFCYFEVVLFPSSKTISHSCLFRRFPDCPHTLSRVSISPLSLSSLSVCLSLLTRVSPACRLARHSIALVSCRISPLSTLCCFSCES